MTVPSRSGEKHSLDLRGVDLVLRVDTAGTIVLQSQARKCRILLICPSATQARGCLLALGSARGCFNKVTKDSLLDVTSQIQIDDVHVLAKLFAKLKREGMVHDPVEQYYYPLKKLYCDQTGKQKISAQQKLDIKTFLSSANAVLAYVAGFKCDVQGPDCSQLRDNEAGEWWHWPRRNYDMCTACYGEVEESNLWYSGHWTQGSVISDDSGFLTLVQQDGRQVAIDIVSEHHSTLFPCHRTEGVVVVHNPLDRSPDRDLILSFTAPLVVGDKVRRPEWSPAKHATVVEASGEDGKVVVRMAGGKDAVAVHRKGLKRLFGAVVAKTSLKDFAGQVFGCGGKTSIREHTPQPTNRQTKQHMIFTRALSIIR